ncbi:ABC transporter substrate-binding protein [Paracoccus aestuariivivens]|uniref:ABC transporter substrate-binding protein n=1 Tax=Paracoccus aestuariivivens TaxID=1820333 RepID=A0A6L6J740_9RHOB|nr:ABC transporter substrate-binding protein [Paracoccus aestuariivivens]MTH77902.1 ABC transporter substrate-binding protein [Paracoccus aestuariivivens]
MTLHPVTRRQALALLAAGAVGGPQATRGWTGAAFLDARIAAGELPAISDRLPLEPRVMDLPALGRSTGKHGGTIRILIGGQRDIRYMPINGYSRLVGFDLGLNLVADILHSWQVEEDRVFTLRLRRGHRWSDGHPFTAEDFRYCWEDVILHAELGGMPPEMRLDGQGPEFEMLDDLTVRYRWHSPLPDFLPLLAAPSPLRICMPAHYMKNFHVDHADADTLARLIAEQRVDDWQSLHQKMSRVTRPENPELPTLDPWRPRTTPPAQQFVFERNPYFHRVDQDGRQLPYIDRVVMNVSSYDLIPAKVATGESDLQPFGVEFPDYTLVKEAEHRFPIRVNLWTRTQGSRVALLPNLTCADPVWRALYRDTNVRRALSLAIDRTEINKALFFGLARESANTVLPESVLYREEYARAWAIHDPEQANALLDGSGLTAKGRDGLRRLPDGRVAGILAETAGESTLEADVLELIAEHYRAVGIALWTRVSQRDLFRSRTMAGLTSMAVWMGLDNAVPTAEMPPYELAPTTEDQYIWSQWGVYYASKGQQGSAPDLPEALELVELVGRWRKSRSHDERVEIWHRMLAIHADQVFTIGTVNGAKQPVVRAKQLQNLPDTGLIGFQPTSILGIYMPDTFWLKDEA